MTAAAIAADAGPCHARSAKPDVANENESAAEPNSAASPSQAAAASNIGAEPAPENISNELISGGNVKKLKECPDCAVIGSNDNAFIGGLLIWGQDMKAHPIVNLGTAAGPGAGKAPKPVAPAAAKTASKPAK